MIDVGSRYTSPEGKKRSGYIPTLQEPEQVPGLI